MSQTFTIDIIECPDPALLQADWTAQSVAVHRQLGCRTIELFIKDKSIRDAQYDFLLICHWDAPWEAKAAPGLSSTPLFQRGLHSVRLECDLAIQLGDYPAAGTEEACWLVNPFEIRSDQTADVLDMWDQAKDYMVTQPGFINARLFKPTEPHPIYNLINVAQWQSRNDFMAALNSQQYDRHREKSHAYRLHPSLCHSLKSGSRPSIEQSMEVAS